jgi:SlyX protein
MHDETARLEDRIEARLTELEIKASYSEDLLDRLNEVVVRQQAQIEALQRALSALREQALAAPQPPGFRSLRDELPPHY